MTRPAETLCNICDGAVFLCLYFLFMTTVYIDSDTYVMTVAEVDVSVTKVDMTHVMSTADILTACSPVRIETSTRTAGAPVSSIYIGTHV